jgi:hypothetical protein
MRVSLADAKAHLSELVERAAAGEAVCITRRVELRSYGRSYGDSLLEASQQPRLPCAVPLYARLGAGFAGCQRPAEPALKRRDPFRRPERSADRGARSMRAATAASSSSLPAR